MDIIPGRCEHLQVLSTPCGSVSVAVLDAPAYLEVKRLFASLLVPRGQEQDWMFCTPNGLWDLLLSASVSRLVVLRRLTHPIENHEVENGEKLATRFPDVYIHDTHEHTARASSSPGTSHTPRCIPVLTVDDHDDDECFKKLIAPLLSSLFPWSRCPLGPSPDPYVRYEDNVQDRVVVELRHSEALGSSILVEDVELACTTDDVGSEPLKRELRRRMRFQQMPNLIQTEVLIAIYKDGRIDSTVGLQDVKLLQQRARVADSFENGSCHKAGQVSQVDLEVRPEYFKLVHKYLPPIVAGLVLASPCLEACIDADIRARFLTVGLGGGALPLFLHKHFGFSVLAVDTDETVVELARRHFGFVESEHLQTQVKDGIQVLYNIANQACRNHLVSKAMLEEWQEASKDFDKDTSTVSCYPDLRMHVIVVDVCVSDAFSGLLSPPPCFLTKEFLLAVQLGLHEGGMLVINVIPRVEHEWVFVVESLRKVFAGIYQIRVDDNHVLFAFCSKIADINMHNSFARRIAHAVGEGWFDQIEEVE